MRFPLTFLTGVALHGLLPLIMTVRFGAPLIWVFSALLFAFGIASLAVAQTGRRLRLLLAAMSGLFMAGSLLYASSWYMQGSGFNHAFLYHLDVPTLQVAFTAFPGLMGLAITGLIVSIAWPLLSRPGPDSSANARPVSAWSGTVVTVLALLTWSPLHSWLAIEPLPDQMDAGITGPESATGSTAGTMAPDSGRQNRNIVLIYAESLEQLYFDRTIFGDILPRLTALGKNAHRFTNLQQLYGTGWTIAGIVASQCGFPLLTANRTTSNSSIASTERPFPDQVCLADVLADKGYENVYLGGADLAFGGKGNFLRAHGYDRVLGLEALAARLPANASLTGWGLYDDQLLSFAREELRRLNAGTSPWMLTVLTLDTHHPRGEPSASCSPMPGQDNRMIDAIHCTDQLLADFIEFVFDTVDMQNTIVVLFSDHLAMRTTLSETMAAHEDDRRLTLMLFDDRPGSVSTAAGHHLDIAPTLLDAAGVSHNVTFGHGRSLFSTSATARAGLSPDTDFAAAPRVLDSDASALETGFVITAQPLAIQTAGLDMTANLDGLAFTFGMFVAVLGEDGAVLETLWTDSYPQLLEDFGGRAVIGISIFEGAPGPTWFAGRVTDSPSTIINQPLRGEARMSGTELRALLRQTNPGSTHE